MESDPLGPLGHRKLVLSAEQRSLTPYVMTHPHVCVQGGDEAEAVILDPKVWEAGWVGGLTTLLP